MKNTLIIGLAVAAALASLAAQSSSAEAAALTQPCYTTASQPLVCTPTSDTTPLPVTSSPSGNAGAAVTPAISASSAATSLVLKTSAGNYYDGYCQSTAAGRCILYNSTTVPTAGALTAANVLECSVVPAGGSGGWQYQDIPRRASVGMVIIFSSAADCNTYTASSTAYIHGSFQ